MNYAETHLGSKVALARIMRKLTQQQVADREGHGSQQAISDLEAQKEISDERLKIVAEAIGVTVDYIKNFDVTALGKTIINMNDHSHGEAIGSQFNGGSTTFNPMDKIIELVEEIKKLYERLLETEKSLLAAEKEKVDMQQQVIALQKEAIVALQQTNQTLQDLFANTKA